MNCRSLNSGLVLLVLPILLVFSSGFESIANAAGATLTKAECEFAFDSYFTDYGYSSEELMTEVRDPRFKFNYPIDCKWTLYNDDESTGWMPGEPWAIDQSARIFPLIGVYLTRYESEEKAQKAFESIDAEITESYQALDQESWQFTAEFDSIKTGKRVIFSTESWVGELIYYTEIIGAYNYFTVGNCLAVLSGMAETRWDMPEFQAYFPMHYDEWGSKIYEDMHPDFDHGRETLLAETDRLTSEFTKGLEPLCGASEESAVGGDTNDEASVWPSSLVQLPPVYKNADGKELYIDVNDFQIDEDDILSIEKYKFGDWTTDRLTLIDWPENIKDSTQQFLVEDSANEQIKEALRTGAEEVVIPESVFGPDNLELLSDPIVIDGETHLLLPSAGKSYFINSTGDDDPQLIPWGFRGPALILDVSTGTNQQVEIRSIEMKRTGVVGDSEITGSAIQGLSESVEDENMDIMTLELQLPFGTVESKDTWFWVAHNAEKGYSLVQVLDGTLQLTHAVTGETLSLSQELDGSPGIALFLEAATDSSVSSGSRIWLVIIAGVFVLVGLGWFVVVKGTRPS